MSAESKTKLHVRKSPKPKRLTKAERERLGLNDKPESNAGVGWGHSKGTNPIAFEEGWEPRR